MSDALDRSSTAEKPQQQAKWTLAVDLAAELLNEKGQATGAGTFDKWQQLKALAARTQGAPINVVVSLRHVDVAAKNVDELRRALPDFSKPADKLSLGLAVRPPGPQVDTFLISNGKMSLLETHNSTGLAADVQNLLETARRAAPSEHLGLHIFAHGSGLDEGLEGDTGGASQQELHDAIKAGLGGREKIDVLDFDACKMASTDTAHNMQDVASFMVASSDDQLAELRANFDGQSLPAAINGLIAAPGQTPEQFARDLVAHADDGLNGKPTKTETFPNALRAGTDTLTAFDLSKYARFETNLETFARELRGHLETKTDRTAIGQAIDLTASYPSHQSGSINNLRDTKQLARNVINQIERGKLTDDGGIRRAAEALLDSQAAMTLKQHNNESIYRNVGGLTTFLPVTSVASRHEMARRQVAFQSALVDMPAYQKLFQFKPMVDANGALIIATSRMFLSQDEFAQMKHLDEARLQVKATHNQAQYTRALVTLQAEAKKVMNSEAGRKSVDLVARTAHPQNGDARRSEWSGLVDDLVTLSAADSAAAQRQ